MQVLIIEPPYGYSPNDVSKYYIKGFIKAGYQIVNFPSHKWLNYHVMSSDYLTKIGALNTGMGRTEIMDFVQTSMMGAVVKAKPDLVLFVHGHCFDYYAIKSISEYVWSYGGAMALIATESPHDKDKETLYSKLFDYIFTTDLSGSEYLDKSIYIGHSYEDTIHTPKVVKREDYKKDVGFVGSFFAERMRLFEKILENNFSCYLSGLVNDSVEESSDSLITSIRPMIKANEELPYIYSGVKFSVNFTRRSVDFFEDKQLDGTVQKSITIRMVECMASGGVLVTDRTEELENNFIDGIHYIGFSSTEELLNKLTYYKDKEDDLYAIRNKAYEDIRRFKNSYVENAKLIMDSIF